MKPKTRNWTATGGLTAALALTMAMRPAAQSQQPPSLPPLAVSQIEDGRRSEAMGQTVSLSFAEPVSIRELLLLLVRETSLSAVIDPDVEGTFSGDLKNVTLRQALDLVLAPHGCVALFEGHVVRVRREQAQTRFFNINYVATRRFGSRGAGPAGIYGQGDSESAGGLGGTRVSVSSSDSGDVFEEIKAGAETLLSDAGRLNVDRKAGLLQVTDYPGNLDRIAVYIEAYETRALRQVRIAGKILEVELREEFSAGIDWALVLKDAGGALAVTRQPAPGAGAFAIGASIIDFTRLLEALAAQGSVNVIASPWVTAMNNEPAVMRVGTQDVYFVTSSQVGASSGQVLQTAVAPRAISEGVTLSVTPQVAADGLISMGITPSVTRRTGTATSRFGDQVPIVSVREADTMVRVREGETVIIAGLMQDRTAADANTAGPRGGAPRSEARTTRKTDLVILLTPTVMTRDEITAGAAADRQQADDGQRKPVRQ